MDYQALYRMYRPQSFDDVVGQTHVTKTLRNAISKGNNPMRTFSVDPEELGKRVSQRCLQRQLIVLTVMMENLVMNVRFVEELLKVPILTS